jgi:uncharacterized PurR-regulated membrane protein YhhQ (DUF165 family)
VIIISAYIGVQMISDISSLQIVSIFGTALDAVHLSIHFLFTLRDVVQKKMGKENARLLIICAAVINLFYGIMFLFYFFASV